MQNITINEEQFGTTFFALTRQNVAVSMKLVQMRGAYDDTHKPLIYIFKEGVFPEALKIAEMTQIFKKE